MASVTGNGGGMQAEVTKAFGYLTGACDELHATVEGAAFEETMAKVGIRFHAADVRRWATEAVLTTKFLKEACFDEVIGCLDSLAEEIVKMTPRHEHILNEYDFTDWNEARRMLNLQPVCLP